MKAEEGDQFLMEKSEVEEKLSTWRRGARGGGASASPGIKLVWLWE